MSLLYADGFDYLPNAGIGFLTAQKYYSTAGNGFFGVTTPGRFGFGKALGYNLSPGGLDFNEIVRPIKPAATIFGGVAVFVSSSNQAVAWLSLFDAAGGAPQLSFRFQNFGVISAWRGRPVGGTLLGISKPGAYVADRWFRFEPMGLIDAVAGAVEARINTVPVIQVPTVNTKNTANAEINAYSIGVQGAGGLGPTASIFFDDLTMCDDQGAVNNTFLGNVRVKTQFMAGPGDATQLAIGGSAPAATNWQSVMNTAIDETKFVYDTVTGHKDNYAVEAILGAQTVHGVQVRPVIRQTDATQRTAAATWKMGGVEVVAADEYLNQTYTGYPGIFELDPSTGLAMIGTDVNAALPGIKITGP